MNNLTHFVMKLIEKLYFIPVVKKRGTMFRIVYEPIISNQQLARIINQFEENIPDDLFIKGEKPKNFINDFIYNYLNYVIYKFLGIKAYRFKETTATYAVGTAINVGSNTALASTNIPNGFELYNKIGYTIDDKYYCVSFIDYVKDLTQPDSSVTFEHYYNPISYNITNN